MELKEFVQKVCRTVESELGEAYRVETKEVLKNNGVLLHGMIIFSDSRNVAPTIYLDHFWRAYEEGMTFAEVIRKLLSVYGKDTPVCSIDMEFFRNFESVRDRICYRLVGLDGNRNFLKDIPHVEFLDLAVCFFYAYTGEPLGEGSILVHDSHMKMWGTDVSELMTLAQRNTPRLFPWRCCTMDEVLRELTGEESEEGLLSKEVPMRVLSNSQRLHGAICLIYQGVLEQIARECASDLYILPSSIHEVILLAERGGEEPGELKAMIVQVNRTKVAPEEVLSDSLYRYDREKRRVEKIL